MVSNLGFLSRVDDTLIDDPDNAGKLKFTDATIKKTTLKDSSSNNVKKFTYVPKTNSDPEKWDSADVA